MAGITAESVGAIEAQCLIDGLRNGGLTPSHAWLAFIELAAMHGWKSPACAAFIVELAKRAAVAPGIASD